MGVIIINLCLMGLAPDADDCMHI